jgi:hypothetical protein
MRNNIGDLLENMSILERYISLADDTWQDDVKRKFFVEFIEPIRNEHADMLNNMEETTTEFERIEDEIRNLLM